VLWRISRPKRKDVAGGWRRLYNEEVHNLCASPSIIRVIISGGMRRAGHVAGIGKMKIRDKFGRKGDHIRRDKMSGACSKHGKDENT